jgi:hypothetical protein
MRNQDADRVYHQAIAYLDYRLIMPIILVSHFFDAAYSVFLPHHMLNAIALWET